MNNDPLTQQRFLAEARAASQLDHPNICVIHDIGETPDDELYIAMPCYKGETLRNLINRGSVPQLKVIDIAIQIAEGLACAHAHNIVHRDIKPANIILTLDGNVKVLDFSIAKVENVHLTQTGMGIGTLAYMSPEQLSGKTVDARTDIWALGVIMSELLTARQAFPATALPDLLRSVLDETSSILQPLKAELPAVLFNVFQQALIPDLQQRFANMNSMIEGLLVARQVICNSTGSNEKTKINTQLNSQITGKSKA